MLYYIYYTLMKNIELDSIYIPHMKAQTNYFKHE